MNVSTDAPSMVLGKQRTVLFSKTLVPLCYLAREGFMVVFTLHSMGGNVPPSFNFLGNVFIWLVIQVQIITFSFSLHSCPVRQCARRGRRKYTIYPNPRGVKISTEKLPVSILSDRERLKATVGVGYYQPKSLAKKPFFFSSGFSSVAGASTVSSTAGTVYSTTGAASAAASSISTSRSMRSLSFFEILFFFLSGITTS